MTTEEPISFTGYWNAVDEAMLKLFAVDTTATGIGPDLIAAAQEVGRTPEDFAIWSGEKYGLNNYRRGGGYEVTPAIHIVILS
jgi:hypothetical protein